MRRVTFGLLALLTAFPAFVEPVEKLESLTGMSVLIEVYVYNPVSFQVKKVARTSLLETMEIHKPDSENWFIRPYKSPATPFTQPEFRGLVDWSKREQVPGLVLDNHPELGDEDIVRLQALPKLVLLSLRKTGITDQGMQKVKAFKNLRFLDISDTRVTGRGLAALKPVKLKKLAVEQTSITPDEFEKFQASKKGEPALLSSEWSTAWDTTRNPEPLAPSLSMFAGAAPDESIPGHLPKGKFKADYNLQLKTLDGSSVNLASQKGRVIFMNIWKTGCGACRSELPGLESLYAILKEREKKFFFAYVSPQPAQVVQAAMDQQPRNLPVYVADETALERYTSGGLPATIIISKSGEWVVHRNGAVRWDDPGTVSYLKKLMDAPDK